MLFSETCDQNVLTLRDKNSHFCILEVFFNTSDLQVRRKVALNNRENKTANEDWRGNSMKETVFREKGELL